MAIQRLLSFFRELGSVINSIIVCGEATGSMFNLTDNVGIGTDNPTSKLTVADGNLEFITGGAVGKIAWSQFQRADRSSRGFN